MSGIDDAGARERLAAAMEKRREQAIRVTWAEIAHRAGMTSQNLYRIRENKIGISWDAERGIERALQWAAGSITAILSGRAPTELSSASSASELDTDSVAERPDDYTAESGGDLLVGSDEWLLKYVEYPDVIKVGLEVRRKRRELEGLKRILAAREAEIAEDALPHGGGERS